jgi:hypothetical protein
LRGAARNDDEQLPFACRMLTPGAIVAEYAVPDRNLKT